MTQPYAIDCHERSYNVDGMGKLIKIKFGPHGVGETKQNQLMSLLSNKLNCVIASVVECLLWLAGHKCALMRNINREVVTS